MEKSLDSYPYFHPNKRSCRRHLPNDYFSSLPVEVLLLILSLLPLKEMVKTSILSKRWLNLWVNTPVLDFHKEDRSLSKYFVDWVDQVLPQHMTPHLKKFRICYKLTNAHREDIDRWLEFALARKVEILELNFLISTEFVSNAHNYVFPNSWFISTSGRADADGGKSRFLQSNLKFLKSLILKNVHVAGETIEFFLKNCLFLERLEIVGSHILVDLVISDPTLVLKHLKVKQCHGLKVLSISNFKLVSLDTSVADLILNDLPMLVELSIYGYAGDNNLNHIVSQNATCLRQLKHLELSAFNIKKLTEMVSILTQLTKLKRLVVHYASKFDESMLALLNIIKSCNCLEEFVLELKWYGPKRSPKAMEKVERLGFENLKLFEFKGYYGRATDLELMIHILKNAPRLEKIIIDGCDLLCRLSNYPVDDREKEARRFVVGHIYGLRKAKIMPPHVAVLIR